MQHVQRVGSELALFLQPTNAARGFHSNPRPSPL